MPGRVWRSDSETREGYTGHGYDAETGMNYAGLRYYPSALGRWLTPDPAGQYASPYDYVGGDPVNMIDPDGAYGVKYDRRRGRTMITRVRSGTMYAMNWWDRLPGAAITSGFMRYNRRGDNAVYESYERQNAAWAPVKGFAVTGGFAAGAGAGGAVGGATGWGVGAAGGAVDDALSSKASADQVHMDRVAFQVMGWLRVDGSLNLGGSQSAVFNVMDSHSQAGSDAMYVSHQMQQAYGAQTGTVVSAILNAIVSKITEYADNEGLNLSEQSSQDAALNYLLQNWSDTQDRVVKAIGESAGAGASGGGSSGRSRAAVTMCRAQNDSGC